MALIKATLTDFGITADYWKVDSFCVDATRKEASFILNLYINSTSTKYLDSKCIDDFMIMEDKTLFDKYFNDKGKNYRDWQTACYEYVKNHVEFFKDAVSDEVSS